MNVGRAAFGWDRVTRAVVVCSLAISVACGQAESFKEEPGGAPGRAQALEMRLLFFPMAASDGVRDFTFPIEITSPSGKRLLGECSWSEDATSGSGLCHLESTWYEGPGVYSVHSVVRDGTGSPLIPQFSFELGDSEVRVEIRVTIDLSPTGVPEFADLQVSRIRQGLGDVLLVRQWNPSRDQRPVYDLVNKGTRKYFGTSWMGHFNGRIERASGEDWVPFVRGGICGTVPKVDGVSPGKRVYSSEGALFESIPFDPGRYRYIVDYATDEIPSGIPAEGFRDANHRQMVHDVYEVVDEFSVVDTVPHNSALQPSRSRVTVLAQDRKHRAARRSAKRER